MTIEPAANLWERHSLARIVVCIGFYVVADLMLFGRTWFFTDEWLLVAIAVPMSQSSLAALWSASSQASLHWRFFLPPIVMFTAWLVLTRLLPWGIGEPASAAWAIAIVVQTLTIIAGVKLYRIGMAETLRNQSRFRYDLQTLILWTTVIALAFTFVRFGRERWQWTIGIVEWPYFMAAPLVGVFNALVAVLWWWSFSAASWSWRFGKIVFAVVMIASMGCVLSYSTKWLSGFNLISVQQTLVLAAAHSVLVASSLAVVQSNRWMIPAARS